MICPRCGVRAEAGKNFCGDCGHALPRACPSCNAANLPNTRFCGDCGAALPAHPPAPRTAAAAPSPAPERRLLTILFADLVGSTALGQHLDPEDLRETIGAYHACVAGLVARFDGSVAQYLGDGVLALFGYPRAHEDDAERAVRAGLAVAEAVERLATGAGALAALRTRVGIATGLAVVGDAGSGSSHETAVVGEAPNLAARLQALAEPGAVMVCGTTRRLVGRLFECRSLGPTSLKGFRDPVEPWAVLNESAVDSRFEALRPGQQSPLVGRAKELLFLQGRWGEVEAGEGRVVMLSGQAGIGKSRLVAAFERSARREPPAERIRLLCSPHHQDTALHPVIRYFERAAGFERGDPPAARLAKLRRSLADTAPTPDELALLAELLSIPRDPDAPAAASSPGRRKELTLTAILGRFEALARRSPLLLVCEDLHWADPTSLHLLDQLVETAEASRILLLATARPEFRPPWADRPQVSVLALNGLNRRQAAVLVGEAAPGAKNLPDDVVARIVDRADGVPLFIEELTRAVVESGPRRRNGGPDPSSSALSADAVPESLQASLLARLDRIPTVKEVVQIASVIGREFSFEMLRMVSTSPPGRLEDALDELARADLIVPRGLPPRRSYSFKHALVQDAAYGSLLRERRRAVHLRVTEALEAGDPDAIPAEPQVLAWHFGEAGLAEKAVDRYLEAAQRATGRSALAERVIHLRKGVAQLARLPASPDRTRREIALQLALGRALIDHQGSGSEEVRLAFERARELSLSLGDTGQLLKAHDGLMNYHFTHSEPEKVAAYAGEMLEVGDRTGEPQALLMARRSAGLANLLLGRLEQARDDLERVVAEYVVERDGPQGALTTRDPKVSTCTVLGMCLTALGFPAAGAAASLDGVRHAEALNHPISLILGLRRACVEGMMRRDAARVERLSRRLLAVDAEHTTFLGSREGAIFQGWARQRARPEAEALGRVRASLEQLDAAKHWVMLPFFMASTAELLGENGDRDGGAALLGRAAELVGLTSERWCEAEIFRLRALHAARDPDEAAELLLSGLALAKRQGAKLWELRAAVDLARLWCRRGERAAARDLLRPVHGWFARGHDMPELAAARELLDALEERCG